MFKIRTLALCLFLFLVTGITVLSQAEQIPSGIPQQAAAAMEKAKNWRADAVLVMVDVNDLNKDGNFQIKFSFYSPADQTGLWVITSGPGVGTVLQAGPVNWSTQPIPKDFLDLPAAVEQARKEGMQGTMDHAMLQFWEGKGLAWRIAPVYDPNLRVYDVAALSGGELNPRDADFYYNRGNVYFRKGQYDQAISDFTKAIELNPRYAEAYNIRGIAYDDKGLHDQAISDHTKAIEINPNDAVLYNNRGNDYSAKGQYDQAISDFTKAIEINPRFATAYIDRGAAYYWMGQYDQAISDCTKAIEIKPNDAHYYKNRASAYYQKGEYSKAWEDVRRAQDLGLNMDPEFLDKLRKASGREW